MSRLTLLALAMALGTAAPALAQDAAPAEPVILCYFAGLEYSTWAELPNGQICLPTGIWSYPQDAKPDEPAAE